MRNVLVPITLLFLFSSALVYGSTIEATTRDGRTVLLFQDGTWKYKEDAIPKAGTGYFRPADASSVIKSKKGFFQVWYIPEIWGIDPAPASSAAEISLKHSSGDAYAMIIIERIAIPLESLRDLGVNNVKKVDPNAQIVVEEDRLVGGTTVRAVQIDATAQGIPLRYYNYYWSGETGAVQFITFTGQNLFQEFKYDLDALLNGMVITKK